MKQRILMLLPLTILLAVSVQATTYHVATTGSDTNPGTSTQPFRTITKAVTLSGLTAGDEVQVHGGTYNETVTVWHKYGTEEDPIYIIAAPNETPVIDGTGKTGNAVVAIDESSYIHFDGFEVTNGSQSGILVWDADHIKVGWCNVHDCQKFGIHAGCDVWGTTHDILFEGNDVHSCVLENSARTGTSGWVQALSSYQANYVEMKDNYVYENYGEGIDLVVTDHGNIHGNWVSNNYSANIYLDNAQYVTVDRNFVSFTDSGFTRGGSASHGIAVANEYYSTQNPATDITVTNNISAWCKTGFHYGNWEYNGGLHNTTIANNTFYHSEYANIWIQTANHDTTVVKNNIFSAYTTVPNADAPTSGFTYAYNNWYGGTSGSTITGSGDIVGDPKLVNPSNGTANDFKLQSTSPCRNAGTTVSAVTTDYFGATRSGTYDIGAHEYN
jgi:hypothetical protein